jgi:hypothetical protein
MVASYVFGYEAGGWWTFFFERESSEVAGLSQ